MERNSEELKVSVITPCYNCDRFLEDTIKSVLKQDYSNWELILVNDGSSDRTEDIIQKYVKSDSRIRSFSCEKPSGSPAHPRNIGIQKSVGDIILFLDSDDVITPDKMSSQIPLFAEDRVAISFSDYQVMDRIGNVSSNVIKCPHSVDYYRHLRGCSVLFSNAMFDTRKIGKPLFEKIGAEDYAYILEILKQGYLAKNTGLSTSYIRKGIQSVSSNKWKSAKWNWNIYYNHQKLGFFRSVYYFSFYAVRGLLKYTKYLKK